MLLVAIVKAGAQSPPQPPPLTEPLEKPQDPPMYIWRTDSSPRMVSQLGAFTSFQVNVGANGQNIVGDAANEASITVDPSDPNKMAIGWRQFNSVMNNFRQAGWAYTTNGGSSWTFPGVLQNNVFRSDPVLYSNQTGAFYYLSLVANFQDDMWHSLTGGQSWNQLAFATGGDKQWFTIDRTNSSGHGFQYQSWSANGNNYNGRQFTRSTDGGSTWMELANISTRALTAGGNNAVFAGFTLGNHQGDDTVAVRGLGPSLTSAGVPDPLQNPTLELRSADGTVLAANDDWQEDQAQAAALTNAHLALPNHLESGIVEKLPPGAYTALLLGAGNSAGIGLIEIYDLGP
jgi:hypothetical protein